jgi:hypothetical protein
VGSRGLPAPVKKPDGKLGFFDMVIPLTHSTFLPVTTFFECRFPGIHHHSSQAVADGIFTSF